MIRTINDAALQLIKSFEGCRLTAYQDQRGIWTAGFGHTGNVNEGDVITQEQADQYLLGDLQHAESTVGRLVHVDISDNQFGALCSLTYNIGSGNFQSSTMLKLINKDDFADAANEFLKWNHVNGVPNDGLLRRRSAERDLFLTT